MKINSIQFKLIAVIFLTLIITILFVLFFTMFKQRQDLLEGYRITLSTTTSQLNVTIRNLMISGEAPVAVNTMRQYKEEIPSLKKIDIFRENGVRAFSDFSTMKKVNERLKKMGGNKQFQKTERLEQIQFMNEHFKQALETKTPVPVSSDSKMEIEYYFPILNYANYGCTDCHGQESFVRGIACINISTKSAYDTIRNTSFILTIFFIIAGILTVIILIFFLRRLIVNPLISIGQIVNKVENGNFKVRVNIKGKDELGKLGRNINRMIKSIEERVKLSKYVSKSTDRLIQQNKEIKGGEKKKITVLFSDIRGFTSYSEKNDPQTVIESLNMLLQVQSEVVEKFGGDVDKFVGDELMAIFDNEYDAVLCSYEMVEKVIEIDKKHNTTLHVGIGINSGEIVAGNIGSKNRLEYAVIGDTVNLASRLCSIAKKDMIVISDNMVKILKGKIKATQIPNQKIKGKEKKIDFYVLTSALKSDGEWVHFQNKENILKQYASFPFNYE